MSTRHFTPEEIWKAMEGQRVCFMAQVGDQKVVARPMTPIVRRNENLVWFVTARASEQNELADENPVTLLFQDQSDNCYVTVTGSVSIVDDRDRIDELWSPVMKEWFNGPDDPRVVCLSFDPREADIWDGPHRVVAALKMLVTAGTGTRNDMGSHAKVQM